MYKATSPDYIGHRQRIKEKLLNGSSESFTDYELLEAMLFSAIPRRDVKPLAKRLLKEFGGIGNLLYSDKDKLLSVEGATPSVYANLLITREILQRALKEKVANRNVVSSWCELVDYLRVAMSNLQLEQFRVLFLNKKNILIADEVMSVGTIDQTAVYPREIVKKALFHEACAIILVHNHPSGNFTPSNSDIELTKKIVKACGSVGILVHDHVIIAGGKYFSFKSNILL